MTVPKLGTTCFTIRAVKPYMTRDTIKMIYYFKFYSLMNYGLIFWGNPHTTVVFSKYLRRLSEL
jgi:hypothetical protein